MEDHGFLTIAFAKGIIHFGVNSKLNPWYIGSFEIMKLICEVAFWLTLLPMLSLSLSLWYTYLYAKKEYCKF